MCSLNYAFYRFDRRYELFVGMGIFWINLNRTNFGCWRLTLRVSSGLQNSRKLHQKAPLSCLILKMPVLKYP